MASEFIFPFGRLNLASLTPEKRYQIIKETGLVEIEAVEIFKYEKNNVVNKVLLLHKSFI